MTSCLISSVGMLRPMSAHGRWMACGLHSKRCRKVEESGSKEDIFTLVRLVCKVLHEQVESVYRVSPTVLPCMIGADETLEE